MAYHFDIQLETKKFEINVSRADRYGCFEHKRLGEDCGGGLWFEMEGAKLALCDYDGVCDLPREVVEALKGAGIDVSCCEMDEE